MGWFWFKSLFSKSFTFLFIRNREFLSSLTAAAGEHCSSLLSTHARAEPVSFCSLSFFGLVSSFGHKKEKIFVKASISGLHRIVCFISINKNIAFVNLKR
jgi:hypothetical protein